MKKKFIISITILLIFLVTSYLLGPKLLVKTLERRTVNKKLDWHTIYEVSDSYKEDDFDYLLFTNEFHWIDDVNSYEVIKEKGFSIFLITEEFESGKDGTITKEKNLYILKGIDGKSYSIPISNKDFFHLQDKIRNYLEN